MSHSSNVQRSLLPQIRGSNFSIPVELPSGAKTRFTEFKNRNYLVISKYCENNDFVGFLESLKPLIDGFDDLNLVDKAYALVLYRSFFLGNELQVLNTADQTINLTTDAILEKLDSIKQPSTTLNVEDFTIELDPISSYVLADDTMYDCIKSITYDQYTVTGEDISQVFDKIPTSVFSNINKAILHMYGLLQGVTVVEENATIKLPPLIINLTDDTFGHFIMTMFKTDLNSFFESLYVFSQHLQGIDYLELSPLDSRVVEGILHREISEAKKKQESSNTKSNPLTP